MRDQPDLLTRLPLEAIAFRLEATLATHTLAAATFEVDSVLLCSGCRVGGGCVECRQLALPARCHVCHAAVSISQQPAMLQPQKELKAFHSALEHLEHPCWNQSPQLFSPITPATVFQRGF